MHFERKKRTYYISSNPKKLDWNFVITELKSQYWANELSVAQIKKSIKNSRSYGIYHNETQIGFAKVLSDQARFAYLSDVFIIEKYRKKGLATFLIESILMDPHFKDVEKWMLATRDAHRLYAKLGFSKLKDPKSFMQYIRK